ncbi:MAG TPA: helical backbone metal receptor [Mycobacteriales bacterium]|jgi:ABC-type Fe3+-hydroxamate transport system substrate-binding protein|nr:helical backbone metal receptor [Mycobacteriales bacterium]
MATGELRDDTGASVRLPHPVRRVVSLVPSLTESVEATAPGLIVGATAWCSFPPDLAVPRIGGTKNPDVAAVLDLAPDLVLANQEENRDIDLQALRNAGAAVWITAPTTVPDALNSLGRMLTACGLRQPDWLAQARERWAAPHTGPRRRAVIPIWRRPWMALGRATFAGDVLRRIGVDNVLAGDPERYPRFEPARLPPCELVILPDEPYPFNLHDGPEAFPGLPSRCVSGRHLTWYGPSLVQARAVLGGQLLPDPEAPGGQL